MAATIHRDPYAVLIRKIGYSVGLEATKSRLHDLVEEYARTGDFTLGQWTSLVRDKWGLETEHIAKVFSSLNVISVSSGAVDIGYGLDALAIMFRTLARPAYDDGLDAVLTALIVIADADIFLNCLASGFEPDEVERRLLGMIRNKRNDAYQVVKLSALRERVDRAVNIETQKTNRGGAAAGKGLDGLKRTVPLVSGNGPLPRPADSTPTISPDYLRKVPPRRRDWARSIGLFGEDQVTPAGEALLSVFANAGCRYPDGSFTLWPFPPELAQIHLTRETAPWRTIDFAELVELLAKVFDVSRASSESSALVGNWLRSIFDQYRQLNASKSMLRNELPLRVALLVQLGQNVALHSGVDLMKFLASSAAAANAVSIRQSRHHEGAVVFRKR